MARMRILSDDVSTSETAPSRSGVVSVLTEKAHLDPATILKPTRREPCAREFADTQSAGRRLCSAHASGCRTLVGLPHYCCSMHGWRTQRRRAGAVGALHTHSMEHHALHLRAEHSSSATGYGLRRDSGLLMAALKVLRSERPLVCVRCLPRLRKPRVLLAAVARLLHLADLSCRALQHLGGHARG